MQVPGRDGLPVHAREVIECGVGVAALILAVRLLHFPIVNLMRMGMPGRGIAVDEGELGLLQGREWVFEQ
jgi:hypothetical protein